VRGVLIEVVKERGFCELPQGGGAGGRSNRSERKEAARKKFFGGNGNGMREVMNYRTCRPLVESSGQRVFGKEREAPPCFHRSCPNVQ